MEQPFQRINWNRLARNTGFRKRKPIKIKPVDLLKACCTLAFQPTASLQSIAVILGFLTTTTISKQAVAKRFSADGVRFFRQALGAVIGSLCQIPHLVDKKIFGFFGRVLIQDSTHLKLSASLAEYFPSSRNQTGKDCATVKIQTIYDFLAERFVFFSLSSFRRNDQASSPDILSLLRPGDLIIRDLGYFVLSVLEKITQKRAFFLTRFRYDTSLWTEDGKTPISLLKLLRCNGKVDRMVFLGQKQKIQARLVAVPLPPAVAASRRRKARQHHDKRSSHSQEYLALLDWQIFLTNIPQEIWKPQTLCAVYGLRWRIEIIFKTWKSHFHLTQITSGSRYQIEALVYARLIFLSLFQTCLYQPLLLYFRQTHQRWLSLLKFAQFYSNHFQSLFTYLHSPKEVQCLEQLLLHHCTYEKRKIRSNFSQNLLSLG